MVVWVITAERMSASGRAVLTASITVNNVRPLSTASSTTNMRFTSVSCGSISDGRGFVCFLRSSHNDSAMRRRSRIGRGSIFKSLCRHGLLAFVDGRCNFTEVCGMSGKMLSPTYKPPVRMDSIISGMNPDFATDFSRRLQALSKASGLSVITLRPIVMQDLGRDAQSRIAGRRLCFSCGL